MTICNVYLAACLRFSANENELIAKFDASVVLDRQIVDLILTVALIAEVRTSSDRSVDSRRLESDSG